MNTFTPLAIPAVTLSWLCCY